MAGTSTFTRCLEILFFVYFVVHIPLLTPKAQYTAQFKDVLFAAPPVWFQSFIYAEMSLQLPFFFVAAYAFYKGNCPWIRIPAIVYSSHVVTTVIPIVAEIYLSDFSYTALPSPQTLRERNTLVAVYAPFLVVPFILLGSMLFSQRFKGEQIHSGRGQDRLAETFRSLLPGRFALNSFASLNLNFPKSLSLRNLLLYWISGQFCSNLTKGSK